MGLVATSRRLRHHLRRGSIRVLGLVFLLWLLNLTDLLFTLLASTHDLFVELNPLAAPMTSCQRIIFKLTILALFSVVAYRLRGCWTMEVACGVGLVAYLYVVWIWLANFLWLFDGLLR